MNNIAKLNEMNRRILKESINTLIENEQLRYCVERLNSMDCETDEDIIFQGQCMAALWEKIYRLQPELVSELRPIIWE